MVTEQIIVTDNRAAYRKRLAQKLKIDPTNTALLKKIMFVRFLESIRAELNS